MRKKLTQKVYNFTAVFEPAQEGGYIVYAPALPGCTTQGETFEEALDIMRDAIQGYLLTLRDLKEDIPSESAKIIVTQIPATIPA